MEWVAPAITGFLGLLTVITAAIIGIRNTRTGAREQRAPDVMEAWAEADRARGRMRAIEDLFYALRGAFRGFARRVTEMHPTVQLTDEERTALESSPPVETNQKE